MLKQYKMISIIYGGSGAKYAQELDRLISTRSNENRYPLSSLIVMEKILTGDLLANVVKLFEESEFCVAFLTADDCYCGENGGVYRLRQNVIFELGMAIFRLGRERCILLSDFDPADRRFELPSDLNGIDVKFFTPENQRQVFDDVLDKILLLSCSSVNSEEVEEAIPQYDHLLERRHYFVDYESLFSGYNKLPFQEGNPYLKAVLEAWQVECGSFQHYEERCIYFFERIGFLPVFGRHEWVYDWCVACEKMLSKYNQADIAYCGVKKLNFIQNLAYVVSGYTKMKLQPQHEPTFTDYEDYLTQLTMLPLESSGITNPLVATVYYDYLGLLCMRLFDHSGDMEYLINAIGCFEMIMQKYVEQVDMSLNIWSGFVSYNLGRAYLKRYGLTQDPRDAQNAQRLLTRATLVRKKWLSVSGFNATVRSVLSYEYFISKMELIHAMDRLGSKAPHLIRQEYKRLEGELESYLSRDEQLERLRFVQRLLLQRQSELEETEE